MSQMRVPVVVVVGAAGGIGLEIVRSLHERAHVLGVVQNEGQLVAAREAGARDCLVCDITDSQAVAVAIDQLLTLSSGQISALIVSAAMQPVGAVETIARVDLERLFAVNVFGALEVIQGLLPALRRSKGRIVLFSSLAGRMALPLVGAYAATKFAIEGLADSLRRELRSSGVSVSLVEPGGVNTPMAAAQGVLAERGLAGLSPELRGVYGSLYSGYRAMTAKALRFASNPADVARIACKAAIGSAVPRVRYVSGTDAKLMLMLARWLPVSWLDALLVKVSQAK
ncbi:SDR family NAD(P)-dependent oxidoreductase [Pseudomonas brassicacearum]|uniref:SDR family NAD(P)-dependent oxidoreductase n=1 Tax=Pseudomonas brassicacearum TaxID=930166 RepID=UPI000F48EAA0|nr:SDR family NAD(P)-dependent oxidoreductase [Pseudomonas brassicacearum]